MSTQQDIYAAGFKNHPPMLNNENYVPWSSRLLRYAKSRPNEKLIYNFIINGPYVRRMIPEPGDAARTVRVPETFHEQTDDELTKAEIKQIEANDQAIQSILLDLPEDIYAAVVVVKLLRKSGYTFTSTEGESIESYYHRFLKLMNDFKRDKHFLEKIASNLKFLNNLQLEWSRHVTIVHQTKDLHIADYTQLYDFLKYNQKVVDELRAKQLAKTQNPLALMANSNNPFNYPVFQPDLPSSSTFIQQALPNNNYNPQPTFNQNYMQQPMPNPEGITDPTSAINMALVLMAKAGIKIVQNVVQNPGVQNLGNQNRVIVVLGIANYNGNGNVIAARAEGNANRNNGNQIRCYNCRGLGHLARNYTVRPRRRDAAYLQTQLLIAQKEEARIQLQAKKFDLMAAATDLDEIEEVNANCILMANLPQVSTSVTQSDKAPVYDSDGSGEVQLHDKFYDNEIFNMFTQEEQYTELLEPILEPHQVLQNDSNVTSVVSSVEQGKQITALNEEISYLNKQLSKEKSTISSLQEEKKRLKSDFKIREDELLDKQIQLENKIKELDNILVKTEFSDDTTPNVARKFLNEIYKIVKYEIFHIVNQVDARVQNFEKQFLKEAAKFVRDFQSLAKEADESLAKHKALEWEIERLLRAVVSQDIMSVVQNNSVVDTSNLQTELECTKERFENCVIKKENEYAKLWNDWYKKCEECKYDKILYGKAYNGMQQKIERLQAQLRYLKGKSKDTPCVSNTLDPLPRKLENENVELEFQVQNYEKENARLKTTSNSVPTTKEPKVVENDKVIAPGIFSINPFKNSREVKSVPNKPIKPSVGTNSITVPQPHVITKKAANSDSNGFSSTGVDITTKTRRPQPRSNTKNDRVPSASKSSRIKNKEVEVENHLRILLLSKNKKHMSFECNNIKLAIRNDKSEIKQKANVSNIANQTKHKARVWKPKNVGSKERLASPKPSKPRMRLRWSPTGKMFDIKGKLIASSESNGDNACTPNPQEPTIKRFPNSTFSLGRSFWLWLWHQRLSHLNFDTINDLDRNDIVTGLSKFKYHKEHLCPLCEQGKSKRVSHPPKHVPNSKQRLHLLHMDLCGPMRIASINGKRSKDEAPEEIKTFLKKTTVLLQALVIIAARTMLIFSHAPLFLWAEAIATACYTQNRSIIHCRFDKTQYELINGRKLDISFLHVFGALYYPKNDHEDIGKLGAKETMNVTFDELSAMAFEQSSLRPGLQSMTSGQISSGLDLTYALSTITTQQPTEGELDLLFEAMYNDHIGGKPLTAPRTISAAQASQVLHTPTTTTTTTDTAPTPTNSSSQATNIPSTSQNVDEIET
ncbi:retrovirus-related pol polyprotein from transposon TNT 1-94 [Tanacetum coccineum]